MQWMGIDQYLMVMQIADLNSETTKKWRDVENPPGLFQKKKKILKFDIGSTSIRLSCSSGTNNQNESIPNL